MNKITRWIPALTFTFLLFTFALPSFAADKPAKKKTCTLSGTVTIQGEMKKVQSAGSSYGEDSASPEQDHLVVYLEGVPGKFPAPKEHQALDQLKRRFTTDVLPILKGTTVDFTNHDRFYHNVFSDSDLQAFDIGRKASGEKASVTFKKLPEKGIGVINVYCEIHSKMLSHILVMRNPFWAILPETGGGFEIKDIPAGTYTLTAWHSGLEAVPVKVTLKPGQPAKVELVMKAADESKEPASQTEKKEEKSSW